MARHSPIDEYQMTASVSGGGGAVGPVSQTVSGATLSATLAAADAYDWSVQARAHHAAGWGAWSFPVLVASGD